MKPRKLKGPLALNKHTITDLSALAQRNIKAGAEASGWTCPLPTLCVPANYTECGLNCELTDYTCDTNCGQYTCDGDTCQATCDALITG